ncbi:hypothetical protein FQA39_LY10674 [Lamprigera yunnana]|nr:hypothetical protein FQA39_LY10674 [Lamprigera yunnana]
MFAIDCIKANGTHLGTCIDGFYFGSCCHIKQQDINDNSIDTAIIPSRQPPSRISSTTKRSTTKLDEEQPLKSTAPIKHHITNSSVSITTSSPITLNTTSSLESIKNASIPPPVTVPPTHSITIHTTSSTSATPLNFTNVFEKITTIITTGSSKVSLAPETIKTTEMPYKLTTFQSIESNAVTPETATKLTQVATTVQSITYTTKHKEPSTSSRPKVTTKYTKFTKPTTNSTRTTKPTKTVTRPTVKKPINKTTISPSTITKHTSPLTTEKFTKPALTNTEIFTTNKENTSDSLTHTNEIQAFGNTATNEIDQIKPLVQPPVTEESSIPSFITWSIINQETTKPSNISQEWKPITTPDGWVLLPSLLTTAAINNITTTNGTESYLPSSEKPIVISTLSTPTISSTSENVHTNETSLSSSGLEITSTTTASMTAPVTEIVSSVNMSDFTDVCGRRMYPEARIVGGERATFGKWPWQISLRQWRTSTYLHKCGAALLNENWAITAAHCVDNVPPSDLLLRLGEHDLSTDNEPYIHQERRVQIVAAHPQFDPRTFEYDLALLRFYEPVQFQPNIIPVCVPKTDENFVGRTAYVTGWGRLYEDGPLPSVLQQVAVPVINNTVCEAMYRSAGYIEHIPHIFICAGWRRGGFDSCEGDSGGPMVIQREDKRFLLAGVISWGIGCAEPNQPGVYTRISEFKDWINQILQF